EQLNELNDEEQLRLCNGNGRTVGIFVAPTTLEQMNAERERLAEKVAELEKRLDETQRLLDSWKEKAQLGSEREALLEKDWHSMFQLLPRELQVREDDIAEIQRDPHTFEELFQEWEQK